MQTGTEPRTYSTGDAAALLGVTPSRIRAFVDAGVLPARPGPSFTFRDLVVLRTAKRLANRSVPSARVGGAVRRLRTQLPTGASPSAVALELEGTAVVARSGERRWHPESGQGLLTWDGPPRAVVHALRSPAPAGDVESLFAECCALETSEPAAAQGAYRDLLRRVPAHAEAQVNLGRLLHAEGALRAAESHYRAALAIEPGHATAAYNLAVALGDQGRLDAALSAYHRALELDEACADAHFNLSRLHEARGEDVLALRHLAEYRRLLALP